MVAKIGGGRAGVYQNGGKQPGAEGEYLDLCDRKQDFRWTSVGREATRNFVGDLSGMQI